jgi:hypothetical protein
MMSPTDEIAQTMRLMTSSALFTKNSSVQK